MRLDLQKLITSLEQKHGSDILSRILLDFYEKASQDVLIGFFFDNKNLNDIAYKQSQFMLQTAGFLTSIKKTPSINIKSPKEAHEKLAPILSGHFDRRLVLLQETLNKYGLSKEEQQVWLSFEEAFRKQVVSS